MGVLEIGVVLQSVTKEAIPADMPQPDESDGEG